MAVVVIDLPRVAAESVTPVTKSFTEPDFPQPLMKELYLWRKWLDSINLTLCPSKCLPCHLSNGEGVVSRPSNWSGICKWVFWQKISRCLSPWWRRHRILTRFHPRYLRVGVCDPWTLRLDAQLGGILKDSRMKYKTEITKTTELAV